VLDIERKRNKWVEEDHTVGKITKLLEKVQIILEVQELMKFLDLGIYPHRME
jgi:hypothetical protein